MSENSYRLTKDLIKKDGVVFARAGIDLDIWWENENAEVAFVGFQATGKSLRLRTTSLPKYFNDIEMPDMDEMEEYVTDSVCPSVFGTNVEPDGWDEHSPSWLLAMAVI